MLARVYALGEQIGCVDTRIADSFGAFQTVLLNYDDVG